MQTDIIIGLNVSNKYAYRSFIRAAYASSNSDLLQVLLDDKSDILPVRERGLNSKLSLSPGPQMSKQTTDPMDEVLNKHNYLSQEQE